MTFGRQGQVALFDPADPSQKLAENHRQHGGQDEADQNQSGPVEGRGADGRRPLRQCPLAGGQPARPYPDLPAQAAGAHAGVDGIAVHLQPEQTGGDGPGDRRGQGGRNPDAGVLYNIAHLEHGGAQALGDQPAPAVLPEGHDREAHHLGAAARHGGSPR